MAVTPVTVGDHLVARMRAAGISVVCGLPTSRLDSLLVRLSRDAGFQIVLARHEGGAGYLADGFARASGKSAAVFVAGPGATNVISAVANASVNQVPMLILTGEVAVGEFGLHSQQDTSDDGLGLGATFRRFCRCSVSIESIANARSKIDSAFRALASIPRGPVHIALPRDLVDERLPAHQLGTAAAGLGGLRTLAPCGPDVADEVIGRLDRSRAPMLVLGNGCRLDGIGEQIVAFCEKAGLPFATTPNGRGIVAETHPLSLGVLGIFGDGRAAKSSSCVPMSTGTRGKRCCGFLTICRIRARLPWCRSTSATTSPTRTLSMWSAPMVFQLWCATPTTVTAPPPHCLRWTVPHGSRSSPIGWRVSSVRLPCGQRETRCRRGRYAPTVNEEDGHVVCIGEPGDAGRGGDRLGRHQVRDQRRLCASSAVTWLVA